MWSHKEIIDLIHEIELLVAALTGLNCAMQGWRGRIHRREDRKVLDDTNRVVRDIANGKADEQ